MAKALVLFISINLHCLTAHCVLSSGKNGKPATEICTRTHPQRYRPAHAHLRMRGLAAAALLDGWQATMVVHGSPAASTGASQAASSSATSTSSTLKRRYDWKGARHTGHLSSVRWSKQWWQTHRWRHGSRMVSLGLDGQQAA